MFKLLILESLEFYLIYRKSYWEKTLTDAFQPSPFQNIQTCYLVSTVWWAPRERQLSSFVSNKLSGVRDQPIGHARVHHMVAANQTTVIYENKSLLLHSPLPSCSCAARSHTSQEVVRADKLTRQHERTRNCTHQSHDWGLINCRLPASRAVEKQERAATAQGPVKHGDGLMSQRRQVSLEITLETGITLDPWIMHPNEEADPLGTPPWLSWCKRNSPSVSPSQYTVLS